MPSSLTELAIKYGTDKFHPQHYTYIYEHFLESIRDSASKIFEIGIREGFSMCMWRDYFPNAVIYGIDNTAHPKNEFITGDRIVTRFGCQEDKEHLKNIVDLADGHFDVIIDDGSHRPDHQQISLAYLLQFLRPGGIYVIEDLHATVAQTQKDPTYALFRRRQLGQGFSSKWLTPVDAAYINANIVETNIFTISTDDNAVKVKFAEGSIILFLRKKI